MCLAKNHRTCKGIQFGNIIALNNLIIIILPFDIAIDTIADIKEVATNGGFFGPPAVRYSLQRSNLRSNCNSVYSGTAVFMFIAFAHKGIVLDGLADANRLEDRVVFRVYCEPVHPVNINDGNVELGVCTGQSLDIQNLGNTMTYFVVLALKRSIYLSVLRIESHRAEVTLDAVNRCKDVSLHVCFDKAACE